MIHVVEEVFTLRSDGDDDTESGEDGHGGTDDDLHGVVRGVVWCPGTVWAESDEVGCTSVLTRVCFRPYYPIQRSLQIHTSVCNECRGIISIFLGRVQLHEFPMTS